MASATSLALVSLAFLSAASASSRRLGLCDLDPERLFLDHQQELAFLDVRALLEVPLLQKPLHPRPDGHLIQCPGGAVGMADDRHVHLAGPHHRDRRHRGLRGAAAVRPVAAARGRATVARETAASRHSLAVALSRLFIGTNPIVSVNERTESLVCRPGADQMHSTIILEPAPRRDSAT